MDNGNHGHGAGGGAAAAADLAKARHSLGAAERDDDAIRAARDVFRDIDVLLKALRTYDASHPRISDFHDRLQMSLGACLVHTERLSVALQPRAVLMDAEILFETERIETNPWFPLFADGIRHIDFRRGMSRDEIVALVRVMRRALDKTETEVEFDSVTLLWECELQHVRFHAIDSFVAGNGSDADERLDAFQEILASSRSRELAGDALTGEDYARGARVHRDPSEPTGPVLESFRAENLSIIGELPDSARAVSYRLLQVDDDDFARLTALCEQDRTYAGRYFGALLTALAHRGDGEDGPLILECLRELCLRLIAGGELRKAYQMLVHLNRAVPGAAGVADFLIPDEAVERIVAILAEGANTDIEEEALALISALSPGRALSLLQATQGLGDARLRARMNRVAASWGACAAQAAGELLRDSMGETAVELIDLLRTIGGSAAHLALEQASFDTSTATRTEALHVYFQLAPHSDAIRRAERGLRAPDAGMRRASLEFLVAQREPRAANWLRGRIRDPGFASVDIDERKRVYRAYALLGGSKAGRWLLEKLEQRNTLGRARLDDERILAAYALGHLRYQQAKQVLEQLASARMTRRELRQACAEALQIIDDPAEDPATQPRDPEVRPTAEPSGKLRPARERRPRETDLPAYRGAAVDGSALSTVTSYLVTGGRHSRDSIAPEPRPDAGPRPRRDVESLMSDYVGDPDE